MRVPHKRRGTTHQLTSASRTSRKLRVYVSLNLFQPRRLPIIRTALYLCDSVPSFDNFVSGYARLGGTISILSSASVGETTVLAGGILSPGNSIGTLTVDGSLQLASGSTFEVKIAGNGASDRVNARNMATISGGTLPSQPSVKTGRTISSCTLIQVLAERLILLRRDRRFLT